jgi:hypothetical protein
VVTALRCGQEQESQLLPPEDAFLLLLQLLHSRRLEGKKKVHADFWKVDEVFLLGL